MTQSNQPHDERRAPRVKLAGTILALLRLENGRQVRARLHQLSITGGLIHLEKPVDEGIKVEVMFHVGSSTVRSKARMLFPMWATQGCLQPFEFSDLRDEDRQKLEKDLQKFLDQAVTSTPPLVITFEETSDAQEQPVLPAPEASANPASDENPDAGQQAAAAAPGTD
jgi:hypothetical protein